MTEEDMIHFQKITWCCISSWLYGDTLQWWWRLFETHIESCQFIGWWHHQIHKRTHLNNHHSLGRLDIIVLILKGLLELPFELLELASDRIQMILFLALTSVVRNQENCPVRALWTYVNSTSQWHESDELFACFGGHNKVFVAKSVTFGKGCNFVLLMKQLS